MHYIEKVKRKKNPLDTEMKLSKREFNVIDFISLVCMKSMTNSEEMSEKLCRNHHGN